MTETVIAILIFIICFIGGYWWGKATKKTSNTTEMDKALSAGLVDCVIQIGNLREDIHKLRNFLTSQASESSKKVDWEPDDYKDPYSGVSDKVIKAYNEVNAKPLTKEELENSKGYVTEFMTQHLEAK